MNVGIVIGAVAGVGSYAVHEALEADDGERTQANSTLSTVSLFGLAGASAATLAMGRIADSDALRGAGWTGLTWGMLGVGLGTLVSNVIE